jgi:hypothetical protein
MFVDADNHPPSASEAENTGSAHVSLRGNFGAAICRWLVLPEYIAFDDLLVST